jgi:LysM repeat protein
MKARFGTFNALWFLLLLALAGCAPTQTSPAAPVFAGTLQPYRTATPLPPTATSALSSTPLPTLTPTPRTYTVVKGDDLFGIALRFGITLDELQAANPNVDPRIISIGTVLIIPPASGGSVTPTPAPDQITPTPVPLDLGTPSCSPSADGGLWCFVLAHNNTASGMENISAIISLYPPEGAVQQQTAVAPLNHIAARDSLPLAAYFPAPAPETYTAAATLRTAMLQPANDTRYLEAQAGEPVVTMTENGRAAHIQGEIALAAGQAAAGEVWLLASALDANGNVVGIRKWTAASGLAAGKTLPYDLWVYSTGAPVDRVVVQVEVYAATSAATAAPK